jgi:formyl-CoA transferase
MALDGIKVVDLSQMAAVPMAARLMADYGAEVVHIEHPERGDLLRGAQPALPAMKSEFKYVWENYNHNKKGIAVDISTPEGQAIVHKLITDADVLLSNLRPYQLTKFKLEYESLVKLNPRLIFGNLTGYGRLGERKDVAAYDNTAYWARAGIVHRSSRPGGPPSYGIPAIGDNVASLALLSGIMTALFVRERTGVGQEVDVSLFRTGVYHLSWDLSSALATGADIVEESRKANPVTAENTDNRAKLAPPLMCPYQTSDGRWVIIHVQPADKYWSKFCHAIEREDLEHDERFTSETARNENRAELFGILEAAFESKTLADWNARLADIPSSSVQNLKEVVVDPQARTNECFASFTHPEHGVREIIAGPVKFSKTPASTGDPAPSLGEHTDEILKAHGYSAEAIADLRQQGVVA